MDAFFKAFYVVGCSTNYPILDNKITIWGIHNREWVMKIKSGICENILKALNIYSMIIISNFMSFWKKEWKNKDEDIKKMKISSQELRKNNLLLRYI